MTRTKLTCHFCGEPIIKAKTPAFAEEVLVYGHSQIERAWHRKCGPNPSPPETPFQAALVAGKQWVANLRNLTPDERAEALSIIDLAHKEQR